MLKLGSGSGTVNAPPSSPSGGERSPVPAAGVHVTALYGLVGSVFHIMVF